MVDDTARTERVDLRVTPDTKADFRLVAYYEECDMGDLLRPCVEKTRRKAKKLREIHSATEMPA